MFDIEPGTRVEVFGGDGSSAPRGGVYVGSVTVYAYFEGEVLRSMRDAETPPTNLPEGVQAVPMPNNPKFQMDDGTICYGCQVWWSRVVKEPAPAAS